LSFYLFLFKRFFPDIYNIFFGRLTSERGKILKKEIL
jgi:hypothetical protein